MIPPPAGRAEGAGTMHAVWCAEFSWELNAMTCAASPVAKPRQVVG